MKYWIQNPDGQRYTSVSVEDIIGAVKNGTFTEKSMAWHEGLPEWVPLSKLIPTVEQAPSAAKEAAGKAVDFLTKTGISFAGIAAKGYKKVTLQNRFSKALASMLEDGHLDDSELEALQQMVREAGGKWADVVAECRPISVRYIRHLLADSAEDGVVTAEEEINIWQQVRLFALQDMNSEIDSVIRRVRVLADLAENRLPTPLSHTPPWLKSGEAVYYCQSAEFWQEEAMVSAGHLWITNLRVEYVAGKRPCSVSLKSLREAVGHGEVFRITDTRKGIRYFRAADGEICAALVHCLLRASHRTATVVESDTRQSRRRISQEVRNAVWIRDGGQCIECGAQDYLEFDHVIPVAKGGGNTVNNIQLLCRRCNGKKGDRL